jgi:hypothetical protein
MATNFYEWADLALAAKQGYSLEDAQKFRKQKLKIERQNLARTFQHWVVKNQEIHTGPWSFDELIGVGAKVNSKDTRQRHSLYIAPLLAHLAGLDPEAAAKVYEVNLLRYKHQSGTWDLKFWMNDKILLSIGEFLQALLEEYRNGNDIKLDEKDFPREFFEKWKEKERLAPAARPVSFSEKTELGWD